MSQYNMVTGITGMEIQLSFLKKANGELSLYPFELVTHQILHSSIVYRKLHTNAHMFKCTSSHKNQRLTSRSLSETREERVRIKKHNTSVENIKNRFLKRPKAFT